MADSHLTAPNPSSESPGPDAEVILLTAAFIEAEHQTERVAEQFYDMLPPWSAEAEALHASIHATHTRYHERLDEIMITEVKNSPGLLGQATVMLWHVRFRTGPDECRAWNLAASVFRVCGQPLPEWAAREPAAE